MVSFVYRSKVLTFLHIDQPWLKWCLLPNPFHNLMKRTVNHPRF